MRVRRPAIERWPRKWSGRPVTLRLSPVPQTGGLAFFLRPADECVVCKWTRTPDSHRVARFCRPMVRRLCLVRDLRMGRPTGAAPAQRSSQDRMLAVTSRPPFESDPPAGAAPAWSPLREECIADLCHEGIGNGAPARTCTSNLRLRRAACMALTPRERISPAGFAPASRASETRILSAELRGWKKVVRHAGAAPAPAVWKTAVLAVTPMTQKKWWLPPVSRRPLLLFREALISLS